MVLKSTSPHYLHVLQNLALISTSFFFFPLSTLILIVSYALRPTLSFRYNVLPILHAIPSNSPVLASTQRVNGDEPPHTLTTATPSYRRPSPHPGRRTILVTGVGMTKGLYLARAFHLSSHRVVGADIAPYNLIPSIGRFSRAIDKFYTLPTPTEQEGSSQYIHTLLAIIHQENISLWVSCSGVASALDDARAKEIISLRSDCICIQFGVRTTQLLHEKDTFTAHAASLGLPVPETHNVTSRDAVHKVLHKSPRTRKRYIMKSVNMDDVSRAEIMTLLPRRTLSETYNHIARLPISETKPWVLQQYVPGNREYCTHALVVRGKVKAFVACPSSELLMHYEVLPHPESALSRAMLQFTEEFAGKSEDKGIDGFTGHLSFDFLIEEQVNEKGVENVLRAIECNPRAHTAVAQFRGRERELVEAYLGALEIEKERDVVEINGTTSHVATKMKKQGEQQLQKWEQEQQQWILNDSDTSPIDIVIPSPTVPRLYWIGHDLINLLLLPLLHLFGLCSPVINIPTYLHNVRVFLDHLLFGQDGTYEVWDPLPAWWLYQVYWPSMFVGSLVSGRRWSRVNVSTCKMFGC